MQLPRQPLDVRRAQFVEDAMCLFARARDEIEPYRWPQLHPQQSEELIETVKRLIDHPPSSGPDAYATWQAGDLESRPPYNTLPRYMQMRMECLVHLCRAAALID